MHVFLFGRFIYLLAYFRSNPPANDPNPIKCPESERSPLFHPRPTPPPMSCQMPRWDLSKFNRVENRLGSSMISVGEVMVRKCSVLGGGRE